MPFPLYLAMTAAELSACSLPKHLCYMACHFSAYGAGLSNLPATLPRGSMLTLNDRTPPHRHDPALVAEQLFATAEAVEASAILLDLQRPYDPRTAEIVTHILKDPVCPVAVSDIYAKDHCCDVFLSAPSLDTPLEQALSPWSSRKVYLEVTAEPEGLLLTEQGCAFCDAEEPAEDGFFDSKLCCHYRMRLHRNDARFTLWRTPEDLRLYLQKAQELGVFCGVGLYQQLWNIA